MNELEETARIFELKIAAFFAVFFLVFILLLYQIGSYVAFVWWVVGVSCFYLTAEHYKRKARKLKFQKEVPEAVKT